MTTADIGVVCKNKPDMIVYLHKQSDGSSEQVKKEIIDVYNSILKNNLDVVALCLEIQKRYCYNIQFGPISEPYSPYEFTVIMYGEVEDYVYKFEFDDVSCSFVEN